MGCWVKLGDLSRMSGGSFLSTLIILDKWYKNDSTGLLLQNNQNNKNMDAKRELELQFHIAAIDGDMAELTRCMDAGVDLECLATESELDAYRNRLQNSLATVALPP